jgi:D-alanine transaminase
MSRTIYLNGQYLPEQDARISVFDRGFLFGDGVYEVIPVVAGKLVDEANGVERLRRSLKEVEIAWPCSEADYVAILRELIRCNSLVEGSIYLQMTRGVAERDFAYPENTKTTFMAYTAQRKLLDNPLADAGVAVVSVPDLRWKRRDIKSLNLLGQCMAKQQAAVQGAFEAWMHEDGVVTEGASSSAFIVKDGSIITRELSTSILPGIRRKVILQLAHQNGMTLEQRAFSLDEAKSADEAFLSSATTLVLPVVSIDRQPVGNGKPGAVTQRLRKLYVEALLAEATGK